MNIIIHECPDVLISNLKSNESEVFIEVDADELVDKGSQVLFDTIRNLKISKPFLNVLNIKIFNESNTFSNDLLLFLFQITFRDTESKFCECSLPNLPESPTISLNGETLDYFPTSSLLGLESTPNYALFENAWTEKKNLIYFGDDVLIPGDPKSFGYLTSKDLYKLEKADKFKFFKKKNRRGGKNKKWFTK